MSKMATPRPNEIAAKMGRSKYGGEHLLLVVDDEPIDLLLQRLVPACAIEGLIPAPLGCEDDRETRVVSARIAPAAGLTTRAPLLICPDDLDFTCTTIVVEAVGTANTVEWRRVGLDRTPSSSDPERVGTVVDWFHDVGPYLFLRVEYEVAINSFKSGSRTDVLFGQRGGAHDSHRPGHAELIALLATPHPYVDAFTNTLSHISPGLLHDLISMREVPPDVSRRALAYALKLACEAQNIMNIDLGRAAVLALPRAWLLANIEDSLASILAADESWPWRRALELASRLSPDLVRRLAIKGLSCSNAESREACEEALDELRPKAG